MHFKTGYFKHIICRALAFYSLIGKSRARTLCNSLLDKMSRSGGHCTVTILKKSEFRRAKYLSIVQAPLAYFTSIIPYLVNVFLSCPLTLWHPYCPCTIPNVGQLAMFSQKQGCHLSFLEARFYKTCPFQFQKKDRKIFRPFSENLSFFRPFWKASVPQGICRPFLSFFCPFLVLEKVMVMVMKLFSVIGPFSVT